MSFNINNSVQSNQQAFRGKVSKTENGTPYWKTTAGATAGTVLAVPAALLWLNKLNSPTSEEEFKKPMDKVKEIFMKNLSEAEKQEFEKGWQEGLKTSAAEVEKQLKQNKLKKKMAIPGAIIAAICSIGCGMAVDNLRNQKARQTADYARKVGDKAALMQGDRVAINNRGKAYYESNEGSKWGAMFGAGCGIIHSLMSTNRGVRGIVVPTATFALGGWLMGLIADHNANKAAMKH